jgi:hypothetical protein
MKKYNSVALIAFTVEHDDFDEPTEEELKAGFKRRMSLLDSEGPEGYTQAVGGDISDTCENMYDDEGNPYPGERVDE